MTTEKMIKEFIKNWPNKCMICSFHKFGRENGMTNKPVQPHKCIDENNK